MLSAFVLPGFQSWTHHPKSSSPKQMSPLALALLMLTTFGPKVLGTNRAIKRIKRPKRANAQGVHIKHFIIEGIGGSPFEKILEKSNILFQ
jgi:hypothetical protein